MYLDENKIDKIINSNYSLFLFFTTFPINNI
jgi:hypothetical protein